MLFRSDALVSLDRPEYACEGASMVVSVFDVDLDADPQMPDTASARVTSEAEPLGEPLTLTETGASTGLFRMALPISGSDAPGVLGVGQDDMIVATYQDDDDGSGVSRPVSAIARVPDCTPPGITGFHLAKVTSDSFRAEWETSEPADSRVLFGPTPALTGQVVVPGLRKRSEERRVGKECRL